MAVNIGPKIGIDGEAEYRKQINNIIQSTKTLKSEYQALETQTTKSLNPFKNFANELSQNKAKHDLLTQSIEEQKATLVDLKNMYSMSAENLGEADTRTLKWKKTVEDATTELHRMEAELDSIPNSMESVGGAMQSVGGKMEDFGKSWSRNVSAPLAGIGVASLKSFSDWESAFTGVMKTVDETATTSYADIEMSIKKMATETASSKEEIAGVAEVAGQLGIKADDIEKFTRTMVELGDSTNLSSEQAATSLARLLNITGESSENIDKVGSAIVALGNNFATSESEIVDMSTRLAAAGSIAGMSTQDILALSTAMSSVGINAEAGGTAMTQTLTGIAQAVEDGGDKLESLAKTSGMTSEEFAKTWKNEPVEALQAFIGGLSKMNEEELNTYSILDDLDMSGIRQSNMLQSLALASNTLTDAVNVSNAAYEKNTALTEEASKRYETFEARLSQTKEKMSNVGVEVGERLLPYVDRLLDGVDKLVAGWDNLSPGTQDMIVKLGLIAAAAGPVITTTGKMTSGFGSLMKGISQVQEYGPGVVSGFASVGTAITGAGTSIAGLVAGIGPLAAAAAPFLAGGAIIAGVIAGGVMIYKHWDEIKAAAGELKDHISEKWEGIEENVSAGWNNVKAKTSETWDSIKNKVNEASNALNNRISDSWNSVKAKTSETWNNVKNTISSGMDMAKGIAQNRLNDIHNAFVNNGGGLKGTVAATWQVLTAQFRSGFDVMNGITGGALGNIANQFWNQFNSLKNSAWSWGADLINNLVAGIRDGIGRVGDAANAVANSIRSRLHFTEPDIGPLSDFHTYMPDMMKGLAQGMISNLGEVEAAATQVAGAIAQPLTTNNYGGISIIVNAAEGQSAEDIADVVEARISDRIERQEAVWA